MGKIVTIREMLEGGEPNAPGLLATEVPMYGLMRRSAICLILLACAGLAVADTKDEMLATGKALCEKGDYEGARQTFTEVIEMDPTCADGYYGRGTAHANLGNYDASMGYLSEAIRLNPRMAKAYRNRGATYCAQKELTKGIADLTEAIRLDPEDTPAYLNRSAAYATKRDYDAAIADASAATHN